MTRRRSLFADTRASAAAEMALVTPLLLILMCGSVELGNYFMNEHTLVKGVRDGARYAARQAFTNFNGCSGTATDLTGTTLGTNTKVLIRKGTLDSSADDLLPNWGSATYSVSVTCSAIAGGTTMGGIYSGNNVGTANAAPVINVSVQLPYRPILQSFGFRGTGMTLNATQQAAGMGL